MIDAMEQELRMRKQELEGTVQTIYFGGGTPSLLSPGEIERMIAHVHDLFEVAQDVEITLEVNPDDLQKTTILDL